MAPIRTLVITALAPLAYLFVCALLAAGFAYPVYRLGGGVGETVVWGRLLFGVLGFALLMKKLGLGGSDLGLAAPGIRFLGRIGIGFGFGALMMGLHVALLVLFGLRELDPGTTQHPGAWLGIFAQSLAIGLAVALIEETIFRGALFATVRRFAGTAVAVGITAFYYADLHFLRSRFKLAPDAIDWGSGFRLVMDAFAHLATPMPDAFLALLFAGILLGCVRAAWPLGLAYCIGLHAGWVFVIKFAKSWTNAVPSAEGYVLVGYYDGITGYLAAAWMGILVLSCIIHIRRRSGTAGTG